MSGEDRGERARDNSAVTPALTRRWLAAVGVVVGLVAVYYVVPMTGRGWFLGVLLGPAAALALVPLAIVNVRRILTTDHPLADVARAIGVLLIVIVLGFAATYYAVEHHDPGQVAGLRTKTDALYLSVTMTSTVGFGDVHPAGQAARAIAAFHMVANLVIIAGSIRLVGWAVRRRMDGADAADA